MYPEYLNTRSQDLEPAFHDAGMFYWMFAGKGLRGTRRLGMEIAENACHDIDTYIDWKIAELKYQAIFNE
jgi:N-acylneuraminate cytidylyltransferase